MSPPVTNWSYYVPMPDGLSDRRPADLNDPDLRHLYELISLLPDPAPIEGPSSSWWDAFGDAGTRQWSGTYYSGKLEDWPLTQTLTQENVRDLAEYCLMFFADLTEEQAELLDQIEIPDAEIRGVGRIWAADMVATAWRLYVPRQALRDGSPVFDRYRRFLTQG
jgi:hypothetical protein